MDEHLFIQLKLAQFQKHQSSLLSQEEADQPLHKTFFEPSLANEQVVGFLAILLRNQLTSEFVLNAF